MGARLVDGECKDTATDANKGFLLLHCLDQLVTQDVALRMLTTSEHFYFFRSTKNDKRIKTRHWETNAYTLEYVGKENLYKEDWIEQPPTLVQKISILGGGMIWQNIQLREHDPSIIASWKSLSSGLWRFLYTVSNEINIFVEHFSSLNLEKVTHKRVKAWENEWWEPDFMFTDQHVLQTKRTIILRDCCTQGLTWTQMQSNSWTGMIYNLN